MLKRKFVVWVSLLCFAESTFADFKFETEERTVLFANITFEPPKDPLAFPVEDIRLPETILNNSIHKDGVSISDHCSYRDGEYQPSRLYRSLECRFAFIFPIPRKLPLFEDKRSILEKSDSEFINWKWNLPRGQVTGIVKFEGRAELGRVSRDQYWGASFSSNNVRSANQQLIKSYALWHLKYLKEVLKGRVRGSFEIESFLEK